jgi:hypothetical protein
LTALETTPVSSPVRCPRCNSDNLETTVQPSGSKHYARLDCTGCARFLRWLPFPSGVVSGSMPEHCKVAAVWRRLPAKLRGTDLQRKFASSVRFTMIRAAQEQDDRPLAYLLDPIRDASWFLANSRKPIDQWRWPSPEQLETLEETPA